MSLSHNASISLPNMQLCLDASNPRSYIGSGTTWIDVSGFSNIFAASDYTYPSIAGSVLQKYFTFVNNGTTTNNIYSSTTNIVTSTQPQYTRIGWFYLTGTSSSWSPIVQNSIGNNADMCLSVEGGRLTFHQYTNSATSGTTSQDYSVQGTGTINTNTWYQGAMVVDRTANTLSLYINGSLDRSTSINVIGNSSSNTMVIGGATVDAYSGGRMFKGYISQIFHYNATLTAADILQNFNAYRGRYGI